LKVAQEIGRESGQRSCITEFQFMFGGVEEREGRTWLLTLLSTLVAGG